MINKYFIFLFLSILGILPSCYAGGTGQQTGQTQTVRPTVPYKKKRVSYINTTSKPVTLTFNGDPKLSVTIPPDSGRDLGDVPDPVSQIEIFSAGRGKDTLKRFPLHPEINTWKTYFIVSDRLNPLRHFKLQNTLQRGATAAVPLVLRALILGR